jgi:phage-related minor tail protein
MADKNKNVVLNFRMDGQVKYAETLKEINAVMNTAAKEYRNHVSAMDKDASATDRLAAEKKKLEIQMEAASKRTQMLRAQYEAMAKDTKTTTGQLTQMYGKLLDAEQAEKALQKSMSRVNDGLSEQAQDARKAKDEMDQLKKENSLLEAEQKKLNSSFKLQQNELGRNASEAEKLELAQRQLSKQSRLTDRTIENLEKQLSATKKIYGENSVEVMQMETKINEARNTVSKFEKSLKDLESGGSQAADSLESLGKKMDLNNLMEATELLAGLGEKLKELGGAAVQSSLEFNNSQTNLQANLGLTSEEVEGLNEIAKDVFRNGVVSSVDEATDAVILTKQTFKDLDNVELENLSNKLIGISTRTKTDFQENIRGAEQLMNGFGMTGEEALNLISAGYQDGLNRSGDFADSLVEYAPLFEEAGFSAEEMLQIMKNGLDNGARNTDLVVDAVKELQIRLGDGTFEDSLELFSDGTAKVFEKWKKGKATVSDVASSIQKDFEKMSPVEQQEALSAVNTQFEDLGVKASTSLFQIGDSFDDVNGKADQMAEKSPGEKWESSLRELQSSLQPIGENLIDALTPILDILGGMGEWFSKLPAPIQTFVTVFGGVTGVAIILAPAIAAVALAFSTLNVALLPIIAIVVAVAAAITGIILVVKNWGAITDWIKKKWSQFISWLKEKIPKLAADFVGWINNLKSGVTKKFAALVAGGIKKFTELRSKASSIVSGLRSGVVGTINNLKTGFVNKVGEIKDGAVSKLKSLRDQASNTMQNAKDKILSPIASAKDKIFEIVDDIKGFFSGMKLSIPSIKLPKLPKPKITGGFSLSPPRVPTIKWNAKGGIFTKPTIFGQYGGRLQGAGEAGPEAALPLNKETLGAIGDGIAATMGANATQPLIVQLVTPDKRVLAEMVVDDVTKIQQRKQGRQRRNPHG